MEKLILKDGTELEVQTSGIGNITTQVQDYTALADLAGKLTKENLKTVQYEIDDQPMGDYVNMALRQPNFCVTQDSACLQVTFGLRELTEEEKQQDTVTVAIAYLTDEQALTVKGLYPTFDELASAGYTAEKQGYRFRDGDDLYKTAQDNVTFQAQYRPGLGTESLYTHINEAHAGTPEDPIPAVANMEYEYGKYYSEGDKLYICKRGGVPDPESMYGQKIILQYTPSRLIGQYFEVVE